MSGFLGVYNRNGKPVEPQVFERMLDTMDHRGPDGNGTWIHQETGLGRQKLATAPDREEFAAPLHSADLNLVIAADVRLDAREELVSKLGLDSFEDSISDALLLGHAYRKWGADCCRHLLGAFAFVIRDLYEEKLFCARDCFGVRSCFYREEKSIVACASEVGALLAHPSLESRINHEHVGFYLSRVPKQYRPMEDTFYSGVKRLPPAHYLCVTPETTTLERYWSPGKERSMTFDSPEEWYRAFRARFRRAVDDRLPQNHSRSFLTLSGGLDSSSITCMADEIRKDRGTEEPLNTFYVDCGLDSADESAYVRSVRRERNVRHHNLHPRRSFRIDRQLAANLDQPLWASTSGISWTCREEARRRHFRVGLTGHGGDTVATDGTGYLLSSVKNGNFRLLRRFMDQYAHHHLENSFGYRAGKVKSMLLNRTVIPYLKQQFKSGHWLNWLKGVSGILTRVQLPAKISLRMALLPVLPLYYRMRYRQGVRRFNPLISKSFAEDIRLNEVIRARCNFDAVDTGGAHTGHARSLLSGNLAREIEDCNRVYALKGVEARQPFLDRRVVEICLQFPRKLLFDGGRCRGVIRSGLRHILPDAIQHRTKQTDFLEYVLRSIKGEDREAFRATLFDHRSVLEPFIDCDTLERYYQKFRRIPVSDQRSWHIARLLTNVADLALWLRKQGGLS